MNVTYIGYGGQFGDNEYLDIVVGAGHPSYNQPAGDLILVAVVSGGDANDADVQTVSDTAGNTYVPLLSGAGFAINGGSGGPFYLNFWYVTNCLGNAANVITVEWNNDNTQGALMAWDLSGVNRVDAQSTGSGTASGESGTVSVAAFSTNFLDEIIIGFFASGDNGLHFTSMTPTSGYTSDGLADLGDGGGDLSNIGGAEHAIVSSAQSGITLPVTFTGAANIPWGMIAISLYQFTPPPTPDAPTFSPGAGAYPLAQSVTISSATPGVEIYFTADGSTLTTASTLYSGPVSVAISGTLKAIAVLATDYDSAVSAATYTIGATPTVGSYFEFPAASAGWNWTLPFKATPRFKTIVQTPEDFRGELRTSLTPYPVFDFEFDMVWMFGIPNTAAQDYFGEVVGFYGLMQGPAGVFAFDWPGNDNVADQNFGTGDGTTKAFPLIHTIGGMTELIQYPYGGSPAVGPSIYVNGTLQTEGSAYTIDVYGNVNFATAPSSGAALTWTGSWVYLCKFLEDSLDNLTMVRGTNSSAPLWILKNLKFRSFLF